ncbi:hypothetical protein FOL47_007550 [Perkinsus chesapeaki]|uniref:Radical SAM core domain-containing protein n=1 Tax=Perkinsus chesapeaki TaxID=330153 RepID=A0A7J6MVF9_PERCH|nr:hypothetical protein FOL47_007550 [Perkinsus chesapeaki]
MPEGKGPRRRDLSSLRKPLLDTPALEEFLSDIGSSKKHAVTIQKALIEDEPDFDANKLGPRVPKRAAALLDTVFIRCSSSIGMKQVSKDGTTKMLIRLQDGKEVETVIIPSGSRRTLCVSSQVGCRMACRFCATGTLGLSGNLLAGEIMEQLWHANKVSDIPITNVVFMGMGEPLENYDAVMSAIKGMNELFNIPQRCITVSTVGVVPKIRELAHEASAVKLALSLHAPTQELRERIVPSAKAWHIDDLMAAVDEYSEASQRAGRPDGSGGGGRKKGSVLVEYVVIRDINDTSECAHELGRLLGNRKAVVNLIPYNTVDNGTDFQPPLEDSVKNMALILREEYGVRVYNRQHHGRDIDAACGQLAKKRPHGGVGGGAPDVEDYPATSTDGLSNRLLPLDLLSNSSSPDWTAAVRAVAAVGSAAAWYYYAYLSTEGCGGSQADANNTTNGKLGFQNALTALHRFARHKTLGACDVRQAVADRVSRLLLTPHDRQSQPTPGMLGNVLWACGKLSDVIDWRPLVEGVCERAVVDDKMLPHHIAHFMWGCASCYSAATEDRERVGIVNLVKKVMVEYFHRDGLGFEPRHVSNIVWSLGTMQLPLPTDFLLRLCAASDRVSKELKDQEDANIIWGLARLAASAPLTAVEGVHAIRCHITARVLDRQDWSHLRPEELGMILWGVAVGVGHEADPLVLAKLSRATLALGPRMAKGQGTDRAIANSLWAFAALRYIDANLISFIDMVWPAVAQCGSGRHLSNTVCALSELDHPIPDALLNAAITSCSYPPTNASGRHAAGLLRAVAASVKRRPLKVSELRPLVRTVWQTYRTEETATARQLLVAALWASLCTNETLVTGKDEINMIISGAMQGFAIDDAASSRVHTEVALVLRKMGVGPRVTVEASACGISVDIGLGGSTSDWFHAASRENSI